MLINCVVYQEGKKLRDIPIEDVSECLQLSSDHFVWVALKDPDEAELDMMEEEFSLHELAIEDARHGHQRPKIEEYGELIFAVIHTVEIIDGELSIGEVDIFVEKNYVLSVRNGSQQDFLGVRARCEREPELMKLGSAFVLYALLDAVVDRYFPIVDALEMELDEIEDHIFSKGSERVNIERLYQLKRKATKLKHVVAPFMEAVSKLYGGRVPAICLHTQEYFRDVHDHLSHINSSIDVIRDTISTAIQVHLSMVTISAGDVNKKLAAWAAIFAAATALAGIWGMNFEKMPELKWEYGYPIALTIMATVCGLVYSRFKKAGWL